MSILANAQLLTLFFLFRIGIVHTSRLSLFQLSQVTSDSVNPQGPFFAQSLRLTGLSRSLRCSTFHLTIPNYHFHVCMLFLSKYIVNFLKTGTNYHFFNTIESIKYLHSARNIILINSFIYSFIQLIFFFFCFPTLCCTCALKKNKYAPCPHE